MRVFDFAGGFGTRKGGRNSETKIKYATYNIGPGGK